MKKILCISMENLGDVFLTIPVLSSLKKSFPQAEIHFLANSTHQQLDHLLVDVDQFHFFKGSFRAAAASLWNEKYDLIINFNQSFQSKLLNFLLFRKTIQITPFVVSDETKTISEHYLKDLSVKISSFKSSFQPQLKHLNLQGHLIDEFNLPANYSVFALGARRVARVISYPKMIELVDRWDGNLVLLGDDWDVHFGDRLAILFPEKVINLCKKTTLEQSAAIINKAEKVITHNSAMLHLSVLLGKQPVVLYTNTAPTDGFLLKGAQIKPIELLGLTCKPCQKIETDVCPLFHFDCGMKLDLDPIFE